MNRNVSSIIVGLILLAATAQAATYCVATNGDDTYSGADWDNALLTISNGVAKAGSSGTVLVSNGTYTLSTQILITNGITVTSLYGAAATIVDGNNASRCFWVSNASALVDGFTITRGYTNGNGGGIYMTYGTNRNCIISNNLAVGNGGGLYLESANAFNCTIIANVSSNSGGGIYNGYLTAYSALRDCVITGNRCTNMGGGVFMYNCIMTNCTINCNTSTLGSGGGVYLYGTGDRMNSSTAAYNVVVSASGSYGGGGVYIRTTGIVSNCLILCNTNTGGYGGAGINARPGAQIWNCLIISNRQTTANYSAGVKLVGAGVFNSTFLKNVSAAYGGGVHSGEAAGLISNCMFYGNQGSSGGGLHLQDLGDKVINCTIVSNYSTGNGGGVVFQSATGSGPGARLTNCIVYFNTCAGSGSNYNYYAGKGTGLFYSCTAPDPIDGTGNITADPLIANLATGDVHLKSRGGRYSASVWVRDAVHSPCIDAGNPAFPVGAEPIPNGNRINMGFYGGTGEASRTIAKGTLFYFGRIHWKMLIIENFFTATLLSAGDYSASSLSGLGPSGCYHKFCKSLQINMK